MLIKANSIKNYKLLSTDGEVGKVKEFFFDDQFWTVRYLIADTGNWLTGKLVLISPYAIQSIDNVEERIITNLSKQQIENSPAMHTDLPVSRQYEATYHGYYGYPQYWGGAFMWGALPYLSRDRNEWDTTDENESSGDPNLRSTKDVSGHNIQATDGEIGHVDDFIIDEDTWAIRYLVIDTQNWWAGKKVLVSPRWIRRVSWDDQKVYVNLSQERIRESPEYTDDLLLTRDYETRLHSYYNQTGYWTEETAGGNRTF
ncbi:MAG TPA: PRC-barrel domain-containing protein [Prolixibacteraceae bacterium]|nr:PRC-barrel domain-containing protein [Prolixibacteraceae bacterium]